MLDAYVEPNNGKTVVYFYGGCLEHGSRKDKILADVASRLVDEGVNVVVADYCKYPEAKYPDFIEDAAEAIAWCVENIGGDIFVGGHSAGAYLTMMVAFDERYFLRRGVDSSAIKGWFFLSGQTTKHFNVLKSEKCDPRSIVVDECAPMFYVRENTNYSKMAFICAQKDIECRITQNKLMYESLLNFNKEKNKFTFRILVGHTHNSYVKDSKVLYGLIKNVLEEENERT